MKFRILTNGTHYKVQYKCCILTNWKDEMIIEGDYGMYWDAVKYFNSYNDAEQWIRTEYGTCAEIVKPFVVAIKYYECGEHKENTRKK